LEERRVESSDWDGSRWSPWYCDDIVIGKYLWDARRGTEDIP